MSSKLRLVDPEDVTPRSAQECDLCGAPGANERIEDDPYDAPFCVGCAAWRRAHRAGRIAAVAERLEGAIRAAEGLLTRGEIAALVDGTMSAEELDRDRDARWWGRLELVPGLELAEGRGR